MTDRLWQITPYEAPRPQNIAGRGRENKVTVYDGLTDEEREQAQIDLRRNDIALERVERFMKVTPRGQVYDNLVSEYADLRLERSMLQSILASKCQCGRTLVTEGTTQCAWCEGR